MTRFMVPDLGWSPLGPFGSSRLLRAASDRTPTTIERPTAHEGVLTAPLPEGPVCGTGPHGLSRVLSRRPVTMSPTDPIAIR